MNKTKAPGRSGDSWDLGSSPTHPPIVSEQIARLGFFISVYVEGGTSATREGTDAIDESRGGSCGVEGTRGGLINIEKTAEGWFWTSTEVLVNNTTGTPASLWIQCSGFLLRGNNLDPEKMEWEFDSHEDSKQHCASEAKCVGVSVAEADPTIFYLKTAGATPEGNCDDVLVDPENVWTTWIKRGAVGRTGGKDEGDSPSPGGDEEEGGSSPPDEEKSSAFSQQVLVHRPSSPKGVTFLENVLGNHVLSVRPRRTAVDLIGGQQQQSEDAYCRPVSKKTDRVWGILKFAAKGSAIKKVCFEHCAKDQVKKDLDGLDIKLRVAWKANAIEDHEHRHWRTLAAMIGVDGKYTDKFPDEYWTLAMHVFFLGFYE